MSARRQAVAEALHNLRRRLQARRTGLHTVEVVDADQPPDAPALVIFQGPPDADPAIAAERWICEQMAIAADLPVQTPTERYVRFRDVLQVLVDDMGEEATLAEALARLDAEHHEEQRGATIEGRAEPASGRDPA